MKNLLKNLKSFFVFPKNENLWVLPKKYNLEMFFFFFFKHSWNPSSREFSETLMEHYINILKFNAEMVHQMTLKAIAKNP